MATVGAQHIITCETCDDKVKLFCNQCTVRLCLKCVTKHSQSKGGHLIVPYSQRDLEKTERLFCKIHKNEVAERYCKVCSVPVCEQCPLLIHKTHQLEDISTVLFEKSKNIWKENDMLRTLLRPALEQILSKTLQDMSEVHDLYDAITREINQARNEWQNIIDEVINELLEELKGMEEIHSKKLQQQSQDVTEILLEVDDSIKTNIEILTSIESTLYFESNIEKLAVVPTTYEFTLPKFVKGPSPQTMYGIAQHATKYMTRSESRGLAYTLLKPCIGSLQSLVEKVNATHVLSPKPFISNTPTITNTIKIGTNHICDITSSSGSFWICQESFDELIGFDENGKMSSTISVKNNPLYITLGEENQFFFSNFVGNEIIKMEKRNTSCVIQTQGWEPRGLVYTKSKKILVCQRSDNHGKVVKYDSNGSLLRSIEFDSKSKPLLLDPTYIAENRNDDICVSDLGQNLVVVFDHKGKHLFSYNGNIGSTRFTTMLSGVYGSFRPFGIATDTFGNILIADHDNNVVHAIDQWGEFIQYVMPGQLPRPRGLSISAEGHLWVGLDEGKIKVIKIKD